MATAHAKLFAERLRFIREQRELSQAELAKKCGMEPSAIAHFEANRRLPGFESLRALCKGLLVSSDYLLGLSERAHR